MTPDSRRRPARTGGLPRGAGRAAAEESPAAARAALESTDQLLATVAGIVERVVFRDTHVDGWRTAVIIAAARLDMAAARRRIRALSRAVGDE